MIKKLLILLALVLISSCTNTMSSLEASKWIAAYCPEQVDITSIIRIEASDSLVQRILTLKDPIDGAIKFSPNIKGHIEYDGRNIDFIPNPGELKQGKEYTCRLKMSKLANEKGLKDFSFSFFALNRETSLDDIKLSIDPRDIEKVIVEGNINFSFPPTEKSLSTSFIKTKKIKEIEIHPTNDNSKYSFKISGIEREENDYQLEIEYDPKTEYKASQASVIVPALKAFKLLRSERIEAFQPYINLEFSYPLSATQDLAGLITIDRIDEVKIEKNGTNVKVFYPNNGLSDLVLRISNLVKNSEGMSLREEFEEHFNQKILPPEIEIPIRGNILPDNNSLTLPFRAVNLAAVDVEVYKIYTDNVLSFLRDNSGIGTSYDLRRYAILIHRQTVKLDPSKDLHKWQDFSVDLKNLFRQEKGAIYNIRLSMRKAYSLYDKIKPDEFEIINEKCEISDYDKYDYDWSNYRWSEREDPTKDSYYIPNWRKVEHNFAASNIGLIIKQVGEKYLCTVSDINTTMPLQGVKITAYNYQLRKMAEVRSDENGFADFNLKNEPFVFVASDGISNTYLKINYANELNTSSFDVSGTKNSDGVKAYIYGERGVWRPGDKIYLCLLAEDKQNTLPTNHPVTLQLLTPKGQIYDTQTLTQSENGIYAFTTGTREDAPTGIWEARFKLGSSTFTKQVLVETIKPNRLKINIKAPQILKENIKIGLEAHWLAGPIASGLKSKIEMKLYANPHPFKDYQNYIFNNPLSIYDSVNDEITDFTLDSLGKASKKINIKDKFKELPGMMRTNIIARVSEPGGDESITSKSVNYSPYKAYVGIDLANKEFETDTDLEFPVVVLDENGNPLSDRNLEYKIYKLKWSWWNEGSASDLSRYVQSSSAELVACDTIATKKIPFRLNYPEWGKYLVYVRDLKGGHSTGAEILIDWPDWRGQGAKDNPNSRTTLSFSLDKKQYEVGEVATVYFPKSGDSRVLLSLENGSKVIKRQWVKLSKDRETAFKIPISKELAPNFYVHAVLLQAHKNTANDLPLRMYGIQGAEVINKSTILQPQISLPEKLSPQEEFTITVSEKDNKPMSYTLAIVDEGLLDITSFKTPQPWKEMNKKEGLGVKTYDMYNDVIGAYSTKFTPLLSIGGDEALRKAAGTEKRFNPVVKFLGPFTLKSGTNKHKLTLPNYIGSVRVMLVAAYNGSYGNVDKTVKVSSPLMILPTLPRELKCGDRVKVPVNLLIEEGAKFDQVELKISASGPVSILGSKTIVVPTNNSVIDPSNPEITSTASDPTVPNPSNPGKPSTASDPLLAEFEIQCDNRASGKALITITATPVISSNPATTSETTALNPSNPGKPATTSQGKTTTTSETIYIEVKNPNPQVVRVDSRTIEAGETAIFKIEDPLQSESQIQISTLPLINFSAAYSFVSDYSHFCTEQLSSRALFLLYARKFLSENERQKAESELDKMLKDILLRQLSSGGFAYWPDDDKDHPWASSMVGEVMCEALRQGYKINPLSLSKWKEYQKAEAKAYRHNTTDSKDLIQAYRLYTLVLSGENMFPDMNRLRESKTISRQALLRLCATYILAQRPEIAQKLLLEVPNTPLIKGNHEHFYSPLRDKAMAMQTYILAGQSDEVIKLANEICTEFSPYYSSTQQLAFVSIAMGNLVQSAAPQTPSEISLCEDSARTKTLKNIRGTLTQNISAGTSELLFGNKGHYPLIATLISKTRLGVEDRNPTQISVSDGLNVKVQYQTIDNRVLNADKLNQTADFLARITVNNLKESNLQSLSLSFPIASGWEIINERILNPLETDDGSFDNQDIRDDRVNYYFSLKKNSTKVFTVRLRAAYCGRFILSPIICEDMYDSTCRFVGEMSKVEVVK